MKRLVFFLGPAGAGKTTAAKALARRRGSVLLDMDTLLRPAAEAIMRLQGLDPDDRDSAEYKRLCRDLGYRITMDAALENIDTGNETFVIGPFTKETESEHWLAEELMRIGAALNDVDVRVIYVHLADEQAYKSRISQRGSKLDQWKLDHWKEFSRSLIRRRIQWPLPAGAILEFDNTSELTEQRIEELADFLNQAIHERADGSRC